MTDSDIEKIATYPADRSALISRALGEAIKEPSRLVRALETRLAKPVRGNTPRKRTVTVSISEKTLNGLYDLNAQAGFATEQTLSLALDAYFMNHGTEVPIKEAS